MQSSGWIKRQRNRLLGLSSDGLQD
eukprot:COSAG01_NODE_36684_length_513_cov_39.328502_2_plen_24_part_01